jgi:hypothetical protein
MCCWVYYVQYYNPFRACNVVNTVPSITHTHVIHTYSSAHTAVYIIMYMCTKYYTFCIPVYVYPLPVRKMVYVIDCRG